MKKVLVVFMLMLALIVKPINVKAEEVAEVNLPQLEKVEDLEKYVNNGGAYLTQLINEGSILDSKHKVVKVNITEPGWLVLNASDISFTTLGTSYIFSNADLTNKISVGDVNNGVNFDEGYNIAYVDRGDYYLVIAASNGFKVATLYGGFIPTSSVLTSTVTYSKDKSQATIKFNVKGDYSTLRMVKGEVMASKMASLDVWKADTNETKLENKTTKVNENGIYTARLCVDDYGIGGEWFMLKVDVTGIKSTKPKTPTLSSYKLNSTVVTGKTTPYTKVTVTIGSKSYKGTADKNGKFSIKTSKLAKGVKIKVLAKNSAGVKSSTTTKVVK